jgi:tetratricopeptide (TPR) repeat protein
MKRSGCGLRVGLAAVGLLLALQCLTEAEEIKDRKALTDALSRVRNLRKQEKQQEALALAEQAVKAAEKLAGPGSLQTATALHELAVSCASTNQLARAEPLFQRGLQIREAKLGKDHLDVAISLHGLGQLCMRQQDYARAEPLWQRCLEIREAKLGKDHLLVATSLFNLGQTYLQWG